MGDLISRRRVIGVVDGEIEMCNRALDSNGISTNDEYAVRFKKSSLVAFKKTFERLPSEEPDSCEGCEWEYAFGYGECHHCKRNFDDMYEVKEG